MRCLEFVCKTEWTLMSIDTQHISLLHHWYSTYFSYKDSNRWSDHQGWRGRNQQVGEGAGTGLRWTCFSGSTHNRVLYKRRYIGKSCVVITCTVKPHSHVTSAFAFFFSLCCPFSENVNVRYGHHHFLPLNPFVIFDENANADLTCEQHLKALLFWHFPERSSLFMAKSFDSIFY